MDENKNRYTIIHVAVTGGWNNIVVLDTWTGELKAKRLVFQSNNQKPIWENVEIEESKDEKK